MVKEKDVATIFFLKVSTWFKRRTLQFFSVESLVQNLRERCCKYFLLKRSVNGSRDVASFSFERSV